MRSGVDGGLAVITCGYRESMLSSISGRTIYLIRWHVNPVTCEYGRWKSKSEYVFANHAGKPYLVFARPSSQEAEGRFAASEGLRDTLVAPHFSDEVR
jgi:hypothetical protein